MPYVCNDCPRECNAERTEYAGKGFCRMGELIPVAKVMKHYWEEPALSGIDWESSTETADNFSENACKNSGTANIFLYGCNLSCCFCQNKKINGSENTIDRGKIKFYTPKEFGELLVEISENYDTKSIGIVSGDHLIRQIAEAITEDVKAKIKKPIVFNCNGYEKPEMLELLEGKIDIFMPDLKYIDENMAKSYSKAPNYPQIAQKSIKKMLEMVGKAEFDQNGLMQKGVIIRHLVMPGKIQNTLSTLDFVNENFKRDEVVFSLMSQYTPIEGVEKYGFKELLRPITAAEKKKAEEYLRATDNITLAYTQAEGVVSESFVPDF